MAGRFRSGEHLKVRRPRGYDHHGIYISDDRGIQFGRGITLTDNPAPRSARSPSPSSYRGAPRQSNAMATRARWTPATTRPLTKAESRRPRRVPAQAPAPPAVQLDRPQLRDHRQHVRQPELDRELPGAPVVRPQGRCRRSAALWHCGPLSGRPVTPALGTTGHHRVGSRRLRRDRYLQRPDPAALERDRRRLARPRAHARRRPPQWPVLDQGRHRVECSP